VWQENDKEMAQMMLQAQIFLFGIAYFSYLKLFKIKKIKICTFCAFKNLFSTHYILEKFQIKIWFKRN
jgi:hypothetical protein